jgi:gas vesicle protein
VEFSFVEFVNLMVGGILGGTIGGVVGWYITDRFAKKSSEELRTIYCVFAEIAQERNLARFVRDKSGRITSARLYSGTLASTLDPVTSSFSGTSRPPVANKSP